MTAITQTMGTRENGPGVGRCLARASQGTLMITNTGCQAAAAIPVRRHPRCATSHPPSATSWSSSSALVSTDGSRSKVQSWLIEVAPLIPNRTTTRSRPATTAAAVTSADAMSASRAGAPAVCESCRTRNVSLAISRNESAVNAGSTVVTDVRSRPGSGFLASLVKLAVEVGEHLVVEGVELLLVGLAFGDAAPNPGDVQECGAEGLGRRVVWLRVAH